MPSSWVSVSPGKMTVWKLKRFSFSFSQAEIVVTAQTQIATTSVSVNTTFFMFVPRLDLMLGQFWPWPSPLCRGSFVRRFQYGEHESAPSSLQDGYGWRAR